MDVSSRRKANQIARHVIDDLIEFSEETSVDGYMSFFKSRQIAKSCGFISRMHEEANTARNLVGQLNALIVEMEALEYSGERRADPEIEDKGTQQIQAIEKIRESNSRLRVEKSRPEAFKAMAELSSLYIGVLLVWFHFEHITG
ncbi:hypothetical protein Tco_0929268 [Tanacetum coccineum]